MPVVSVGETQKMTSINSSRYNAIVKNVLYIAKLMTNLLSVSQFIANGNRVVLKRMPV